MSTKITIEDEFRIVTVEQKNAEIGDTIWGVGEIIRDALVALSFTPNTVDNIFSDDMRFNEIHNNPESDCEKEVIEKEECCQAFTSFKSNHG